MTDKPVIGPFFRVFFKKSKSHYEIEESEEVNAPQENATRLQQKCLKRKNSSRSRNDLSKLHTADTVNM